MNIFPPCWCDSSGQSAPHKPLAVRWRGHLAVFFLPGDGEKVKRLSGFGFRRDGFWWQILTWLIAPGRRHLSPERGWCRTWELDRGRCWGLLTDRVSNAGLSDLKYLCKLNFITFCNTGLIFLSGYIVSKENQQNPYTLKNYRWFLKYFVPCRTFSSETLYSWKLIKPQLI